MTTSMNHTTGSLRSRLLASTLAIALTAACGADLVAQGTSYALRLGPGTYVDFPHHPIMFTGNSATIEYWVRSDGTRGAITWSRYAPSAEHKLLSVTNSGGVDYLYAGSPWGQAPTFGGLVRPGAGSVPADGTWHHVAFVRGSAGTWTIYRDGVALVNGGPSTSFGSGCWATCTVIQAVTPTRVTNESTTLTSWDLDELRISNVERYTTNFTPTRFFTADANTAMHLTFDEGQGNQVLDRGSAQQVGTFLGTNPTWQWIPTLQAAFQPVGSGCVGSAGVPSLTNLAGSLPRPGSSLQLALGNLPTIATVCVPFLGFNNQSTGGMPLPLSLAAYGMPGCTLYTDVLYSAFVVGTAGTASWSVPIPSQSNLLGTHFYLQALVLDAQAQNAAGRTVTNAADATIGG